MGTLARRLSRRSKPTSSRRVLRRTAWSARRPGRSSTMWLAGCSKRSTPDGADRRGSERVVARRAASARAVAERRLAKALGEQGAPVTVALAVGIAFEVMREPDADMVEAGRRELALAMPALPKRQQRDLVRVIWRGVGGGGAAPPQPAAGAGGVFLGKGEWVGPSGGGSGGF